MDEDTKALDDEWGRDPHQDTYYAQLDQLNYVDAVRALISALSNSASDEKSALALFSFDDAGSVVLPVGFIEADQLQPQLRIVPNGIKHMAATYQMKLISAFRVTEPEAGRFYCLAAFWEGSRIADRGAEGNAVYRRSEGN